jgi:Uncharacterized protein affecting Mg2+/Co2+ transport
MMSTATYTYEKTTDQIHVAVTPTFVEENSNLEESYFLWAYQIRIENLGQESVQLVSRYWRIMDAHGSTQEVEGEGVVGEQPILRPGETYEYVSSVPLATPSGFMQGHFHMIRAPYGDKLLIPVPLFSLDSPYTSQVIN